MGSAFWFSKSNFKFQNQIWKIKFKFVPLDWNGSQPHTGSLAGHRGEPRVAGVACEPVDAGACVQAVGVSLVSSPSAW